MFFVRSVFEDDGLCFGSGPQDRRGLSQRAAINEP